jgi:hypothetical protein
LLDLAELFLGGPPRVRAMGLLSSAAARPATVAFGVEAYEDLWTHELDTVEEVAKGLVALYADGAGQR